MLAAILTQENRDNGQLKPTEEDTVKGSEWPELPVLSAMSYSILFFCLLI